LICRNSRNRNSIWSVWLVKVEVEVGIVEIKQVFRRPATAKRGWNHEGKTDGEEKMRQYNEVLRFEMGNPLESWEFGSLGDKRLLVKR
jgi:hypothetical protein